MELALLVYLISLLDPLGRFFSGIVTLGLFALVGILVVFASSYLAYDPDENQFAVRSFTKKWIPRLVVVILAVAFIRTIIPQEKTAYIMVGAYAAQTIAQNEKVHEVGGKVLTVINQKLDTYIAEGLAEAKQFTEKQNDNSKNQPR